MTLLYLVLVFLAAAHVLGLYIGVAVLSDLVSEVRRENWIEQRRDAELAAAFGRGQDTPR